MRVLNKYCNSLCSTCVTLLHGQTGHRLSCSDPVHSGKKELVTEGGAAGPSHCLCNANFLEILLTLLLFQLEKPKESRILSRAKARTQVFLLWAYLEHQLHVQPLLSVFPSLPSTTVGNSSSAEKDCGTMLLLQAQLSEYCRDQLHWRAESCSCVYAAECPGHEVKARTLLPGVLCFLHLLHSYVSGHCQKLQAAEHAMIISKPKLR